MESTARALALLLLLCPLPALVGADDPKPGEKDQDRLQGTWKITEITLSGKELALSEVAKVRFIFEGKNLEYIGPMQSDKGTFKLDVTVSPRAIDMLNKDGKTTSTGIYKFDGNELIWCYAKSPGERPTEFRSKEDSGVILMRLKKVDEKKDK